MTPGPVARDHLLHHGIGVQPGANERPPRHPAACTLASHCGRLASEPSAAGCARGQRKCQQQVAVVEAESRLASRDCVETIEGVMDGLFPFKRGGRRVLRGTKLAESTGSALRMPKTNARQVNASAG